jgi:hypothetical protein
VRRGSSYLLSVAETFAGRFCTFIFITNLGFAAPKTDTYSDLCKKPKIQISLSDEELKSINNATELLANTKLNCSKSQACSADINTETAGTLLESLDLRMGDKLIATNKDAFRQMLDVISAFADLNKKKINCLVVSRGNKNLAIKYIFY